eukprot:UN11374
MGHYISSLNTPAHNGTSNIDYENIDYENIDMDTEPIMNYNNSSFNSSISIPTTSLNEEHERDRINTPSPEPMQIETTNILSPKTDIINYKNPFNPSLLNELVQFGLSGSIYSKSISTYNQFGISSPRKFAAEPGGGKMPNINPNYKAQITQANSIHIAEEKKLNADAPEYIPCNSYNINGKYNEYKPQISRLKIPYSAPNMTNYEHKSPLPTIEETERKKKKTPLPKH